MTEDLAAHSKGPDRSLELLEEWFVRFNPLYLASACLTLSGAWQLSAGIAELRWKDGSVLPAGVLGLYQILLAIAALVVARREGPIRGVTMLALVASLFVIDPTLQNMFIALHAGRRVGLAAAIGSLIVLPFVGVAMLRALHARLSPSSRVLTLMVAGGVALGPHLLDSEVVARDRSLLLLTAWGVAIAVGLYRWPIRIDLGKRAADPWASVVANRVGRFLSVMWTLGFAMHLIGWSHVFEISADFRIALLLSAALVVGSRQEFGVWLGSLGCLLAGLAHPPYFTDISLAIAFLLLIRWRLGLSYRLAVGALLASWAAVVCWHWSGGDLPVAEPWITVLVGILLCGLAFRQSRLAPLVAIPILMLATNWSSGQPGSVARGLILLGGGFTLLGAGVAANLYLKPRLYQGDH